MFALGDATSCRDATGAVVPATAQVAMQQAEYLAWNLRAELRAERPLPFRYANLGEMLSLGDNAASVSSLGLLNLDGPLASASRRAIYAARMPTPRQAAKVALSWAVDAAFATVRDAVKAPRRGPPPPPPRL